MHGDRCIGFLLHRGRQGVEVFTRETQSVGCFPNEREAIGALLNPKQTKNSCKAGFAAGRSPVSNDTIKKDQS
jgi:hypothetical protein